MTNDLPKFGTSGLRGRVADLTPDLICAYTRAFLAACPTGTGLFVAEDLRPSSPAIAAEVIAAARAAGVAVTRCGTLPTPALALAALQAGAGAVMVTGSHIPADRNGLKFYRPDGEISKSDEAAISRALTGGAGAPEAPEPGALHEATGAGAAYVARYLRAFGPRALAGLRLGIYQHSSVARDLLSDLVTALGATAVPLARSDIFIPVDTEAVEPATRATLARWSTEARLDAVLSTDGDADRPMLADGTGRLVPGDVLGVLSALALGAETICTPVSSNSMVTRIEAFGQVRRTRIGSPYVIAAMEAVLAEDPGAKLVGFEANGGFLLGFSAQGPAGPLPPLMTRDAFLPLIAPLAAAHASGCSLAQSIASLPACVTAADRLVNIDPALGAAFLATLSADPEARAQFLAPLGRETAIDDTDGLRLSLEAGRIVHLRPSGNAPEFRVYTEARNAEEANDLLVRTLAKLGPALRRHSELRQRGEYGQTRAEDSKSTGIEGQ